MQPNNHCCSHNTFKLHSRKTRIDSHALPKLRIVMHGGKEKKIVTLQLRKTGAATAGVGMGGTTGIRIGVISQALLTLTIIRRNGSH